MSNNNKYFKIGSLIFTADQGAELFLRKLQTLLLSENSSIMLFHSRDILSRCVSEQGFAVSLKAFLDTARWAHESKRYYNDFIVEGKSLQDVMMDERILKKLLKAGHFEDYIFHDTSEGSPQGNSVSPSLATMTLNNLERDLGKEFLTTKYIDDFIVAGNSPEERGVAYHPNGLSFEKKLKWTELFGQFKDLDRKVCFAALILGKTSEVVDNILENNPEIDFKNLQRDIKKGLSDYDFLSGADIHYQHWFNLQDAYGDWRTVEEDRDLLECVPARIGIEEADDFGYSSINCAFLKGSETLLDLMASTNVVWDSEEVFKQRILDAYERHEWLNVRVNSNHELENISDDMSVVSAIPDSSDAMRYSYLDDFLISFDGTSSAGSNTTDVGSSAEPERSFDLPNQNGVMNNEPPKLSGGDALVPSNGNNYQSKVDTNPLVTNGTLNDTEALTSLEFLYHETYITGIFNQLNPGGVWGFLITIVRFIYGLHQLNFFFLPTHKVKFRKFMKWWRKKSD